MKIFDHKNPRHMQILKEELSRAKRILNEGYSADRIWALMTPEERETAILSTNDDDGPDLADQYAEDEWDAVPADLQDQIDLSEYELAMDDKFGRSLIRGTKNIIQENPGSSAFVSKFLKTVGRNTVEDLTVKQITKLNVGLQRYLESQKTTTSGMPTMTDLNPRDLPSGAPSKNRDWRGGMWTGD